MKLYARAALHTASLLAFSRHTAASPNPTALFRNDLAQKSNQDFMAWKHRRAEDEAEKSATTTVVDVYYHVFISNITNGDDVDNSILEKQTAILNEAFSGKASTFNPTDCDGNPTPDGIDTSFRFRFAGVTRNEDSVAGVKEAIDSVTEDEAVAILLQEDPALFKALQGLHGNQTLFDEAEMKLEAFKNMTRQDQLLNFLGELNVFRVLFTLYGRTQRVGDCSTLNVWVVSGEAMPSTYGVAAKPHWCREGDAYQYADGVLLNRGALPDSNFPAGNPNDLSNYAYDVASRGDTLVHEVGHWLNLEHPDSVIDSPSTGRTGCDYLTGDYVTDTPASGMGTSTYCVAVLGLAPNEPCCPKGADTCPHLEGEDDVTNFMSYSSDCCTNSFTEGQILRMKHSWEAYRGNNTGESTAENDDLAKGTASAAQLKSISTCASVVLFALLLNAL